MADKSLEDPVYNGNDVARDFGAEARSHEVGLKMWEAYQTRKSEKQEDISPEQTTQDLIIDILKVLSFDDLKNLGIRVVRGDVEALMAYPELFYSVSPKNISGERKTTEEVSAFTKDIDIDPELKQIIIFMRNVFAVVAAFAKNSLTTEKNDEIIRDRRSRIIKMLGQTTP